jgi:hypothetical protein
MARVRVEGNDSTPIVKWNQVPIGHVIEGVFLGTREGKFGLLADLDTADGSQTLPLPAVLERQLARVKIGAVVAIQYDGLQASRKPGGKDYHAFSVFCDEADRLPAPPRRKSDNEKAPW